MIIYQKNSCVKELLPDYISIDFPSYCSYTQGNYIIVLFLVHRDNKYDQFYYKLYPISDLDHPIDPNNFCYNVKVEIPHKQANFDIDKYQEYYKKNIYLDNYMENFFYDMCFLNYEDGKDIVMNKRRKEYFQDPYKICIDNCEFNVPPDFTYKRAICNCQNSYPSHSLNNLYEDYYDNNINYVMGEEFYDADVWVLEHLKCLKYIGEDNNIFKNMGSYLIIFFFLFEVVTMIVFGVVGIDSIKMFIIDFIIGNPPKKGRNNNGSEKSSNNNNIKSDISNKDVSSNLMEEKRGNKSVKKKIFNNNFTIKQLDSDNEKIKSWESPDLLVGRSNNLRGYIKNKEIEIYQQKEKNKSEENNDINQKEINTSDKNSNLFSEKKYQLDNDNNSKNIISEKYNHKFTDFELNSMELYDAIKKDKRTFCYFYKLQMLEKQEFYRTFCKYEPIFPISIKIIKYIFNLSLNLVFNALLYTEDQIYEGTKSIGKNIGYIFLRSFYTFLIVKGIDYIINLLVKNSNYLRSLVYRKKREKELRIDSYKSLKRIKACFIFFFVFVIVCDILFWIFLSSFCYCYNGEQAELFGAFLVTQFYIEIYCIVFALYLTVLRFIGLKCRATTCYKLSQTFLDT